MNESEQLQDVKPVKSEQVLRCCVGSYIREQEKKDSGLGCGVDKEQVWSSLKERGRRAGESSSPCRPPCTRILASSALIHMRRTWQPVFTTFGPAF
jgi:hypothetical protein